MTDFSDLLRPDAILAGLAAASKKTLLVQLGPLGTAVTGVDPRLIVERLGERERLGSTGFGGGVAIPHAKLPDLPAPIGVFVRLVQPIDYQSVDDVPVDLVFALFSPSDTGSEHLKALARVSRGLRDQAFLAKLRGAASREAMVALFTAADTRHAA